MNQFPKKILVLVVVGVITTLALFVVSVLTAAWAELLLGVVGVCCLALIVVLIRGQRTQQAQMRALGERVDALRARLDAHAVERDHQVAATAGRFDWIARQQAETVRLLTGRADPDDMEEGVGASLDS